MVTLSGKNRELPFQALRQLGTARNRPGGSALRSPGTLSVRAPSESWRVDPNSLPRPCASDYALAARVWPGLG